VRHEALVERSARLGAIATRRFRELANRYEVIGDVRCPGLFIGVDLVTDRETKSPATSACAAAWEYALSLGLLTEFSGAGANVYKFKPPLTVSENDFERMLDLSETVIAFVDERVHQARLA
jgi:4-aminobutyrate aminotransferase-like enzyme